MLEAPLHASACVSDSVTVDSLSLDHASKDKTSDAITVPFGRDQFVARPDASEKVTTELTPTLAEVPPSASVILPFMEAEGEEGIGQGHLFALTHWLHRRQ